MIKNHQREKQRQINYGNEQKFSGLLNRFGAGGFDAGG
jgi:hypothetical protein